MDAGTRTQLELESRGMNKEASAINAGIETKFHEIGQELTRIETRIEYIAQLNFAELQKRINEEATLWSQEREKYRRNLLRTGPFQTGQDTLNPERQTDPSYSYLTCFPPRSTLKNTDTEPICDFTKTNA